MAEIGFVTPLTRLGGGKVSVTYTDSDGQQRVLIACSPTLKKLSQFEERFGPLHEAATGPNRIGALTYLLWALLQRHQKDLTEDMVGEMFTLADLAESDNEEEDGIGIQLINLAMTGKVSGGPKVAADAAPIGQ